MPKFYYFLNTLILNTLSFYAKNITVGKMWKACGIFPQPVGNFPFVMIVAAMPLFRILPSPICDFKQRIAPHGY